MARPRLQQGSHLLGGAEPDVPYSSNPPTSGWHASGQPQLGVQLDGLSGPALVSALEAGHVVIAYDPDAIEESTQQRLVELATTTFVDRVTVTPWPAMPTAIALAGWGVLQRCHELDEDVLAGFVVSWFGESHRHE